MSGRQYADAKIVCPYFVKQTGQTITCEGVEGSGSIRIYYTDGTAKRIWTSKYCSSLKRYYNCPLCETIDNARKD